jgi:hypothetical protein
MAWGLGIARVSRSPVVALCALAIVMMLSLAGEATGASLSSSKAKTAVIAYVKKKFGSDYLVHPACYKVGARKSRCFVHMVHGTNTCTKYATVKLRGRRTVVSMGRPSC